MTNNRQGASGSGGAGLATRGFWALWWRQVCQGWPHVVLITLAVVVLHASHVPMLEATEAYFQRHVLVRLMDAETAYGQGTARKTPEALVLEMTSHLRISKFEPESAALSDLPQGKLAHLNGTRPLARCAVADLLKKLALQLPMPPGPGASGRVLAIDMDLAPVAQGYDSNCVKPMTAALDALRARATVVAVLMARPEHEDRVARNVFWVKEALCSNESAPAATASLAPLYLASPRLIHRFAGPPLDFPLGRPLSPESSAADSLKAFFPALGNLISLATGDATQAPHRVEHLTSLCRQMSDSLKPSGKAGASGPWRSCTLEDGLQAGLFGDMSCHGVGLGEASASKPGDAPTVNKVASLPTSNYNWLLFNNMASTVLSSLDQLAPGCMGLACINAETLGVPVVVLGVDSGNGNDTYLVPNGAQSPVPGVQMHALQYLSQRPGQGLDAHSAVGVLVDLAAGGVFLALWVLARNLIDLVTMSEGLGRLLKLIIPLALVALVGVLQAAYIGPKAMAHGYWVNPLFVAIGLVLHAYVEAWHGANHAEGGPDFSMGLVPLVRIASAWRAGRVAGWTALAEAVPAALKLALLGWALWIVFNPRLLTQGKLLGGALLVMWLVGIRHQTGALKRPAAPQTLP